MIGTKISWTNILGPGTGSSWNPIQATTRDEPKKMGWACVRVSPGCEHCYAESLNVNKIHGRGTGLPFTVQSLEKIEMILNIGNGQVGIDWPLRAKKSQGIFPCDMTDWLGEPFVPAAWSNQMLSVMALAQHHVFMTLTKRWERLEKMLTYFTEVSKGMEVPDYKTFDAALLKAKDNQVRWQGGGQMLTIRNAKHSANVPWPSPNILFGISVCTQKEAERALPILQRIKKLNLAFNLWISYEPALEGIDWLELGYTAEHCDWLIVGGESGKEARRMNSLSVDKTLEFGETYRVPVYVKQTGSVLAQELGLKDPKGQDVPAMWNTRQFPDVSKSYIPWK